MINRGVFVIVVGILSITGCCYEVPEPAIERLTPKGLRVSIPDKPGVRYFAFHSNLNKPINLNDNGEIDGQVIHPRDNRWTYENTNIELQPTDVLEYWIYVQINDNAFTLRGNDHGPTKRSLGADNSDCERSITTNRGNLATCKNQLIFEEQFDNELISNELVASHKSNWTREVLLPLGPDYEFASYRELPKNCEITNGALQITPLNPDDEYGNNATLFGRLDLGELCTGSLPAECSRQAIGYSILPPVISARLTTKGSFHFRYGKIEIRAKFPKGDWLYPELWLQPKYNTYGTGYLNGRVILGMARGNQNFVKLSEVANSDLGSSLIEFGLRTGPNSDVREDKVTKKKTFGTWNEDFHVYTTIWDNNGFKFHVDDEEVGQIDSPPNGWLKSDQSHENNNKMAPFDNEFYITVGLGVGGLRVFPDWTTSGRYAKPWRNVEAKAALKFWQDRNRWLPSWKDRSGIPSAKFQVDYVKVWTV